MAIDPKHSSTNQVVPKVWDVSIFAVSLWTTPGHCGSAVINLSINTIRSTTLLPITTSCPSLQAACPLLSRNSARIAPECFGCRQPGGSTDLTLSAVDPLDMRTIQRIRQRSQ